MLPQHRPRGGSVLFVSLHADPTTRVGSPENGGITIYVRELARAFVAEGWRVDVVTRRASARALAQETYDGINIFRIDAGPARHCTNDEIAAFLPQACEAVRALSATRAYRFVSSHYWLSGVVGDVAAANLAIPHVHTLHSHGVERSQRDATTIVRIQAEQRLLRTAKIVTLSKRHVAIFQRRYGVACEVDVVPAGVDTARFCLGDRGAARDALRIAASRRWIGYVGRLTKEKGIDDLIHGFAAARAREPDVGLFVVGGATGRSRIPELSELVRRLHVDDAVHFLGPVPNDSVAYAFQAADIIAVPSHYEAFGLTALEARATGTPIVASDVGGLRDLVTEASGGERVPPRNHAAWANALVGALQPEELQRRRALAEQRSRDGVMSWNQVAQKIADIALVTAHA